MLKTSSKTINISTMRKSNLKLSDRNYSAIGSPIPCVGIPRIQYSFWSTFSRRNFASPTGPKIPGPGHPVTW